MLKNFNRFKYDLCSCPEKSETTRRSNIYLLESTKKGPKILGEEELVPQLTHEMED
jgi:hypothetical protein